jgi:hypothetical protein
MACAFHDLVVGPSARLVGKERMRRLMSIVAARRFPFADLVTHSFRLWEIATAYELRFQSASWRDEGGDQALTDPRAPAECRPRRGKEILGPRRRTLWFRECATVAPRPREPAEMAPRSVSRLRPA